MPAAVLARTLAVAGTINIKSARLARAICSTLYCCTLAHMSQDTGCPLISRKVSSVTNSVASRVIITWISAPALRRRLTTSTAL